jgi:hypothetical protein
VEHRAGLRGRNASQLSLFQRAIKLFLIATSDALCLEPNFLFIGRRRGYCHEIAVAISLELSFVRGGLVGCAVEYPSHCRQPINVSLRGNNPKPLISALGQKQIFKRLRLMSALPPKANIS